MMPETLNITKLRNWVRDRFVVLSPFLTSVLNLFQLTLFPKAFFGGKLKVVTAG